MKLRVGSVCAIFFGCMFIIHGLDNVELPTDRCVLTIGNFDGVHLAHQRLIAEAQEAAETLKVPVIILTFEPHPLTIVAPERAPARLCTLSDKLEWLASAGADGTVLAKSESRLLGMKPEDFVRDVLVAKFHPHCIVEGPTFGFGRGRRGTPELLRKVGPALGFSVRIVEEVTVEVGDESFIVSSSLIRDLVRGGEVLRAAAGLGRPYAITGKVVRGHGRGRNLGFPTANIAGIEQLIPGDGVYSGRANVRDDFRPCAISIGTTPTFEESGARQVEAFLLDFKEDIYDRPIRVEFDRLLRPQRRFASVAALTDQVLCDVDAVRAGASDFETRASRVDRAYARSRT